MLRPGHPGRNPLWLSASCTYRYFVDCIVDSIVPEASGRDGLMVTAMIVATLTSLAERRPVKIAEVLAAATR